MWHAGPVKPWPALVHGGSRVGVGGGFLLVAERDAGVETAVMNVRSV